MIIMIIMIIMIMIIIIIVIIMSSDSCVVFHFSLASTEWDVDGDHVSPMGPRAWVGDRWECYTTL